MRPATKRRLGLFFRFFLAGRLVGAGYGGVIGHLFRGTGFVGASIGAIDTAWPSHLDGRGPARRGAVFTGPVAISEIFLLHTRRD